MRRVRLAGLLGAALISGSSGCARDTEEPSGEKTGCLDTQNPVTVGGIFTMSYGASVGVEKPAAGQMSVFASEVNAACGLLLHLGERGRAVTTLVRDGQDSASVARSLMPDMLEEVLFMVGAGGSEPTVPAADRAVDAGVPIGINFAVSDSLTGCTEEQLADETVMKSSSPIYEPDGLSCWRHEGLALRAAGLSTQLGKVAAKWALDPDSGLSGLTRASIIKRYDKFGIPAGDGFAEEFGSRGGEVLDQVLFPPNSEVDTLKDKIPTLVQNDPEIIIGAWRTGELKAFMGAWVELDQDASFTKPSHWDTVRFIHLGSLLASYADIGVDAVSIMQDRAVGISQSYDPEHVGLEKWLALNKALDPSFVMRAHTEPKAYDLLMIYALALEKAGVADGASLAAEVIEVANPPGTKVYPGQFAEARDAIARGEGIDYECAFGACDFDPQTRQPTSVPYLIWRVDEVYEPEAIRRITWRQGDDGSSVTD